MSGLNICNICFYHMIPQNSVINRLIVKLQKFTEFFHKLILMFIRVVLKEKHGIIKNKIKKRGNADGQERDGKRFKIYGVYENR